MLVLDVYYVSISSAVRKYTRKSDVLLDPYMCCPWNRQALQGRRKFDQVKIVSHIWLEKRNTSSAQNLCGGTEGRAPSAVSKKYGRNTEEDVPEVQEEYKNLSTKYRRNIGIPKQQTQLWKLKSTITTQKQQILKCT